MKIKWKKSDDAVSEVIGAILMVGIGVALFAILYFIVMSYPFTPSSPSVDIVGIIEGNNIILEHRGGDSLGLDATVSFVVGGTRNSATVGDYLIDSNGNNRWNVGERLVIPYGDMTNLQVEATVVDMDSNSIVMMGVLQEGETTSIPPLNTFVNPISPYVQTSPSLTVNATGDSRLNNVTLYYRWSDDNISWNGGYDYVNSNTSNVDGVADVGNETNFVNCQDVAPDTDVMTIQEADKGLSSVNEALYVNYFTSTTLDWFVAGTFPYLNSIDVGSYVRSNKNNDVIRWFTFADTASSGDSLSVKLGIYVFMNATHNDNVDWEIDTNGDNTYEFTGSFVIPTNGWYFTTPISGLNTHAAVNSARVSLIHKKGGDNLYIDACCLNVTRTAIHNYNLDFEYQWTATTYNWVNKKVCFYVASHNGTENLLVNYWTGSAWSSLGTITITGWSNFTATGLTSSTYTIQLKGATESVDTIKDIWNIDVIMLHLWNTTSGPHGQNWIKWPNALNPDLNSPWSWNFNFPKGLGYYEFYSIGRYAGTVEGAPASADARCRHT
ncbi:MAG: type IV pilin N-terminal domain-containing protein [Thermoplasmata archaeon]|nr:type IV pilin N-terminal domain-containing protein [Thermoplasmata archaeon]